MRKIAWQSALMVSATLNIVAGIGLRAVPDLAAEPPVGGKLATSSDVQRIMDRYHEIRPGAKDLAWFALDWATTLKEAKERAAREHRPVLFLHTNGRGNLYCGFC